MSRKLRIAMGFVLWAALLAAVVRSLERDPSATGRVVRALERHLVASPRRVLVRLPAGTALDVGTPVRLAARAAAKEPREGGPAAGDPASDAIVGEVEALLDAGGATLPVRWGTCAGARLRLFGGAEPALRTDARLRLVRVPQTGAWVFRTLVTAENAPRLAEEWRRAVEEHREAVFEVAGPVVRTLAVDVRMHLETELPAFLERHREELRALAEEARVDLLAEFEGFFEKELWPIAEPRVWPVILGISREIWEQVPIWGFSWRLAYQALPFTSNDHLETAWRRFLEGKVVPIVRSHSGDFVRVAGDIAREVLSRTEFPERLRESSGAIVSSDRFRALSRAFFQEVLIENAALRETLRTRWSSPETRRAVDVVSARLEPAVRRMGDIVFGTREHGITPEFAKVLRNQILLKDLGYFVLDPGRSADLMPPGSVLPAEVEMEE